MKLCTEEHGEGQPLLLIARVTPVEQIAVPTLVVHGDADRIVPQLLFIEEAPRFNAMVMSFLTG